MITHKSHITNSEGKMQVSKRLVVRKEIPVDNSKDLISSMDVAMAEYYCKNNNL